MGDLRVRLLGGLEVAGLAPVEVGSRKARTLLAALAVAPDRAVATDTLVDVLWGDDQPRRPGEQVGVLVSRLRGVLGAERIRRRDAGYALVADWVDADELEARVASARGHLVAGDGLPARLAATMALDLARGPLLPEEDGPWFDAPRQAAARAVAEAGLVAAEAALLLGDPLGAAAAASVGLEHDPYDESALRALMRAHLALSRPASALVAYSVMRTRLAHDLGVSPDPRTEDLHQQVLGSEPAGEASRVDGWDPLVQRARVELASDDLAGARRDAQEAVRRGGGPGALELAGWTAYYERDFGAALRWAEEAAARTEEEERRTSCLALAARIRHSSGDLAGAEAHLHEAIESPVAGVRAMADVWLGALRVHQGRPSEALVLARRGAVDAAALRHPFVISHSQFAQVYALGQQGEVGQALRQLDAWDMTLADLGAVGTRYRSMALNFRAWVLAAVGQREEADSCSRRAIELTASLQEPKVHALLDLVQSALDAGDTTAAQRGLDRIELPPDDQGTMVWHQHHRLGTLRAQVALAMGEPAQAEAMAQAVVADAAERGAGRAERLARVVVLEARAASGDPPSEATVRHLLEGLDPVAGLERWRLAARLAVATGWPWLWSRARELADALARASGDRAPDVRRWVDGELARLGEP